MTNRGALVGRSRGDESGHMHPQQVERKRSPTSSHKRSSTGATADSWWREEASGRGGEQVPLPGKHNERISRSLQFSLYSSHFHGCLQQQPTVVRGASSHSHTDYVVSGQKDGSVRSHLGSGRDPSQS